MKRVEQSILIRRSPKAVWEIAGDMRHYAEFFVGATRWDPVGEVTGDVGDRYHVLMAIGASDAGGVIELTHVEENRRLHFRSIEGIDFDGEFFLAEGDGGTQATMIMEMRLRGGAPARVVERLAGRILKNNVNATLEALRHRVEWGESI